MCIRDRRWVDRECWDQQAGAYREPGSEGREVSAYGATMMLAALRELALVTGDGRYLVRYQSCLDSLHRAGIYREGRDRTGPGLAIQLELQPGS